MLLSRRFFLVIKEFCLFLYEFKENLFQLLEINFIYFEGNLENVRISYNGFEKIYFVSFFVK